VAVGLPLAYFGTLIVLSYMGISIDLLSIIGMILVVGILVDDAIIVSDRYAENLKKGLTPDTAAFETVKSLIKPVTGTVFTTVVAFSPLILIDNELSYFLYSIPLIVIIALILSYLECFFILPNHLAHFVKKEAPKPKFDIFKPLGELYEKTLKLGLRFRYVSLVFLTGFFALSIYIAAKKVQHKFDLNINAEKISVYLHLKKSSSLDDSVVSMKPVEDFLMSLPQDKIGDVVSSVGSIWDHGRERKGFRYIKISAYINKANRYPSKAKKSVLPEIKKFLKAYKMKNKNVEKLYANYEKEGDDKENKDLVTVKVKGAENVNFKELENEIVSKVQPLDIVSEFIENTGMYINTWEFIPSSQLLLRYGVSSKQLSSQLRSYFVQDRLDEVRINGENVVLYTEIEKEKKPKLAQLDAFEVQSSKGLSVPLKFLGQWHEKQTLREVKHYDGQRSLNLDFKFDEKKGNVELAKQNIEKSLVSIKAKYPTYDISVKNSDENAKKQSAWAMQVALVCILAVLFVISLVLGSVSQALLVGLPIPFGVMGIVWALYLHDLPLGLMALVGLVGTIGVSVNASIVMVDHINQLKKENAGVFSQGQLIVGAASRLRPILLTTVTTLLGVFPMAYSFGGESGFTQPLAFSIGWGLSFSTLLTLVFLPALLLVLEDIKSLWFKLSLRIFKNKSVAVDFKSKILVEPHYKEQVKPAAALDDGGEVPRDLH